MMAKKNKDYDFSMFDEDDVFTAAKVKEQMEDMVNVFGKLTTAKALSKDITDKTNRLLQVGLNSQRDEAKIRKDVLDMNIRENGIVNGMMGSVKKTAELQDSIRKSKKDILAQTNEIKDLSEKLEKLSENEDIHSQKLAKHMEKDLRDKKHLVLMETIQIQSQERAYKSLPGLIKFAGSSVGAIAGGLLWLLVRV